MSTLEEAMAEFDAATPEDQRTMFATAQAKAMAVDPLLEVLDSYAKVVDSVCEALS